MSMNRRGFLTGMAGILAAGYAPSVLPSGIIMPIRKLWTPPKEIIISEFALKALDISDMAIFTYDTPISPVFSGEPIAIRTTIKTSETLCYERGRGWYVISNDGMVTR